MSDCTVDNDDAFEGLTEMVKVWRSKRFPASVHLTVISPHTSIKSNAPLSGLFHAQKERSMMNPIRIDPDGVGSHS